MNLSANFTLEELSFSEVALRKGLVNLPGEHDIANLKRLCDLVLEPARILLGVPLHINSGFRSDQVNRAVGGSLLSAHSYGRAADFVPLGLPLLDAFRLLQASPIPFDQLIFECAAWIHMAVAPETLPVRRQVLTATGGPGTWKYQRVA